jgi:hypothetical protein
MPKIFWELHNALPRECPGDNESTRKAYLMLEGLPENSRILDIGCGPSMQTIELAFQFVRYYFLAMFYVFSA